MPKNPKVPKNRSDLHKQIRYVTPFTNSENSFTIIDATINQVHINQMLAQNFSLFFTIHGSG